VEEIESRDNYLFDIIKLHNWRYEGERVTCMWVEMFRRITEIGV
jgi:hypothetical protein